MNEESALFSTGLATETAIRGVSAGLLEPVTLELVRQELNNPFVHVPTAIRQAADALKLPQSHTLESDVHVWTPAQLLCKPVVEKSLDALIANPRQPRHFWQGAADAASLLRPVNWGHRAAAEWFVFLRLSQGKPLPPDLEQTLRNYFAFEGNMEATASIPIGIELWSFGYGVMQLCRHASLYGEPEYTTQLLGELQTLLEQDPLPAWINIPLAELERYFKLGCTTSVRRLTSAMKTEWLILNEEQRKIHQTLLKGVKALQKYADEGRVSEMRKLGYALHNHPGKMVNQP